MPLNRIAHCDRGAITVTFAVVLVVILAMAGLALDYARSTNVHTTVQGALDASALAAARTAAQIARDGGEDWEDGGELAGANIFKANRAYSLVKDDAAPRIELSRDGGVIKAKAVHTVSVRTTLSSLLGYDQVRLDLSSTASVSIGSYADIHILVDVSSSMGIGATAVDQSTLQASTGCAVACHVNFPWDNANYDTARASGAVLRIDVVREAVVEMLTDMQARGFEDDQIRISIDGFSNGLIPLQAPTTNFSEAIDSARKIDLIEGYSVGTNLFFALSELNTAYPAGGEGSGPGERKSYVILITDGVENSMSPVGAPETNDFSDAIFDPQFVTTGDGFDFNAFQRMQAPDISICQTMKSAGHTLVIGNVDYLLPTATNASLQETFDAIETIVKPKSLERLALCASSPENFLTAHASSEIQPMFEAILGQIMPAQSARIVN